jgi:hypothetical protein
MSITVIRSPTTPSLPRGIWRKREGKKEKQIKRNKQKKVGNMEEKKEEIKEVTDCRIQSDDVVYSYIQGPSTSINDVESLSVATLSGLINLKTS